MLRRVVEYCRQFGSDIWVLSIGWFVGALGFAASIPFIAIYFHDHLGLSTTQIGLFFGGMAIVRSAFQAIGGEISDRTRRKTLLVYAQILRAVAFLGLGLSIAYDLGFWWIAAGMTANGILGGIYMPTLNALVADILPKEKRLDGYALTRSAGNLGWAAGPAIGGFLAHSSYAYLFYGSAVITLASGMVFLFAFTAPPQTRRVEAFRLSDLIAVRNDANLAIHCTLCLFLYLVVAQLIAPFSVYAVEMVGITEVSLGWLFMINGLLVGLTQILITKMFSHLRYTSQMALGALIYFVSYGLLGFSGNYVFMIVIMVAVSTGEMIMSPPSLTITSRLAPDGQMGRYMGIHGFFVAGGWSLGPLYGGWFLDKYADRPYLAWLMIASMALVASVGYALFGRRLPDDCNHQ